jgi:GH25 family lysozyme M1 (1,4-beta-N-acetylmuramidase)
MLKMIEGEFPMFGQISKKRSFLLLLYALLAAFSILFLKGHVAHAAKLNHTTLEVFTGGSDKLRLTGVDDSVKWKSKKPSVASVDEDGVVTGHKEGSCTVVASASGKTWQCKVTVRSLDNVDTDGAMKGIDVSAWQGKINFRKVKQDGIRFVIIRAGHGNEPDTLFERNYKLAKKNGLMVGCYWFVTATSKKAVISQAELCLDTIEGKTFDFPVFVDIESYSQFNKGKEFCSMLVETFCEMADEAGYTPGWYTSTSFVNPYLSEEVVSDSGYVSWVADHSKNLHYEDPCDIWQFSHTGRVDGIKTYVDLNWYFPNA